MEYIVQNNRLKARHGDEGYYEARRMDVHKVIIQERDYLLLFQRQTWESTRFCQCAKLYIAG